MATVAEKLTPLRDTLAAKLGELDAALKYAENDANAEEWPPGSVYAKVDVSALRVLVHQAAGLWDAKRQAVEALGAMPEGYCFCSRDRVGDDSKHHEPECRDVRAAIAKAEAKS